MPDEVRNSGILNSWLSIEISNTNFYGLFGARDHQDYTRADYSTG